MILIFSCEKYFFIKSSESRIRLKKKNYGYTTYCFNLSTTKPVFFDSKGVFSTKTCSFLKFAIVLGSSKVNIISKI